MNTQRFFRLCIFGVLVAFALLFPLTSASAAYPAFSPPPRVASALPGWSGWSSMGKPLTLPGLGLPSAARAGDGHLEVFASGWSMVSGFYAFQSIYRCYELAPGGAWSAWQDFANSSITFPAVAVTPAGLLDVYAQVYVPLPPPATGMYTIAHRYQTAPGEHWSDWVGLENPPGISVQYPAVGKNADGRLVVFARAGDASSIWMRDQTAVGVDNWTAWANLGAPAGVLFNQGMRIEQNVDGRLEVFAWGNDGKFYSLWQLLPNLPVYFWAAFDAPAGKSLVTISAGHNADGRLEIFGAASPGTVWTRTQIFDPTGTTWSDWTDLGKPAGVDLNLTYAAVLATGEQMITSVGSDGNMWANQQIVPNGKFGGWFSLGHPSPAPFYADIGNLGWTSVLNANGYLSIFSGGGDGSLWKLDQLRTLYLPFANRPW